MDQAGRRSVVRSPLGVLGLVLILTAAGLILADVTGALAIRPPWRLATVGVQLVGFLALLVDRHRYGPAPASMRGDASPSAHAHRAMG